MSYTDSLRKQHQEILGIVGQVSAAMKAPINAASGQALHGLLVSLAAKVKVHLATEDKVLYPKLMDSKDAVVSSTSKKFAAEMGEIGGVFKAYVETYRTADAIAGHGEQFKKETEGLFKVLGHRIQVEEASLYPLADKH